MKQRSKHQHSKRSKRAKMLSDKRPDDPLIDASLIAHIEKQMVDASDSTEICGYFEVDSGNTLKIREPYYKGTITETGRHTCQRHGHPTKYLWHTHPINAKFYPSEEDIYTVIKHKVYSASGSHFLIIRKLCAAVCTVAYSLTKLCRFIWQCLIKK